MKIKNNNFLFRTRIRVWDFQEYHYNGIVVCDAQRYVTLFYALFDPLLLNVLQVRKRYFIKFQLSFTIV